MQFRFCRRDVVVSCIQCRQDIRFNLLSKWFDFAQQLALKSLFGYRSRVICAHCKAAYKIYVNFPSSIFVTVLPWLGIVIGYYFAMSAAEAGAAPLLRLLILMSFICLTFFAFDFALYELSLFSPEGLEDDDDL